MSHHAKTFYPIKLVNRNKTIVKFIKSRTGRKDPESLHYCIESKAICNVSLHSEQTINFKLSLSSLPAISNAPGNYVCKPPLSIIALIKFNQSKKVGWEEKSIKIDDRNRRSKQSIKIVVQNSRSKQKHRSSIISVHVREKKVAFAPTNA